MSMLRQFLYQLAESLRVFDGKGLRAGITELSRTLLRVFHQRSEYIVIAKVLSDEVSLPDSIQSLVIHQMTTREELSELKRIVNLADMARFCKMYDHGSVVFAAFQNDQIAGCCWVSQEVDRSVNRVQPPLSHGDACVHDLFVPPAYRGQGIGRALVSHRLRFLQERGYRRAIGAVLKGNVPAFKVNKRTGYIHIGEMSHTRILFWDSFHYDIPDASKGGPDVQAALQVD